MRTSLLFFLPVLLVVLSSCSLPNKTATNCTQTNTGTKSVVLYFSKLEMTGFDTVSGASRIATENEDILGNVEQLAIWISEETASPLAKIDTKEDYPDDYEILVNKAATERSNNFRPKLNALTIDLTDYETIYIGYPIWWADLPML